MAPQHTPSGSSGAGSPGAGHDWPADHEAGPPAPTPSTASDYLPSGGGRRRWLALAGVAVVAAAAGAGITVALRQATPAPASAAAPQNARSLLPTAPAGGGPGAFPGGLVPGQTRLALLIAGRVTAVSAHSITISADGHTTTAAITAATRLTGAVRRIGAVRAGDAVTAQIAGSDGRLAVVVLQDPASAP